MKYNDLPLECRTCHKLKAMSTRPGERMEYDCGASSCDRFQNLIWPPRVDYIVSEIQKKATEEADRFIFETIRPFCQAQVQYEIKKEDLIAAMTHYFPKDRIINQHGSLTYYRCPTCNWSITSRQQACDRCGQRLNDLP